MLEVLDRCRFVYNKMLKGLNRQNKSNRLELQNSIPKLKEEYTELKEVYSKVLQYESYRLFSNLRALARLKKNGKKVGRLRFKGEGWFKTFVYNQSGFKIVETNKRCQLLHLSKIGDMRIRIHRKINGKIKQVVIKHYPSGRWYAFVCCEQEREIAENPNNKAVGIDLGTINFIYDSDGNHIAHPRFLNKSLERLKEEQKRLSRKKKGSKNRQKQRIKVARIHEKIVNQRNDFLHKLSKKYVDDYSFIAVEKLNIRGLIRNSYNPRNILDASWNKFIQFLTYKAERAGSQVVEINPKETTNICSKCGKIIKKELWDRIHKCSCGLVIDRDLNSARNILQLGLERAYKPLETEPLLSNQQVQSRNREAHTL
jgi:putative transposase